MHLPQRTWGVPIPIFYCEECGAEIVNDQTIEHISNLFREHGSDIWFAKDAMELIPDGLTCPKCGGKTRTQIRSHTVLEDFPLFCPKCRYTCVIRFKDGKIEDIKLPDA